MRLLVLSLLLFLRVPAAAAPPEAVAVTGSVVKRGEWTTARVRSELSHDMKTVPYTLKGQPHVAQCVPLAVLIAAAEPRLNPRIKNHALSQVVLAQGRDGYTVAFGLGEILPAFGNRAVWVALDQDGKPLSADDGPLEILVPGDVKFGRWVHALRALTVVDMTAPAKQP